MKEEIERIQWTSEGVVLLPGGHAFSAFQSDSYIARIEFNWGKVAVVTLPLGAKKHPESYWHDRVVERAFALSKAGESVGALEEEVS